MVVHSNGCCQAMFYDTFLAYKTFEVGEAGSEMKDAAEAKMKKVVMGLNKKQKASELPPRLRWR